MDSPAGIRRLLFLSCTRQKRRNLKPLPAIERYDGPIFRVVRRFRDTTGELPETYILSAQFGLIRGDQLIPYYDERMTSQRAHELQPRLGQTFQQIISGEPAGKRSERQLFFCMGKVYFDAIIPYVPPDLTVTHVGGPIGRMSTMLHQWLHGRGADAPLKLSSNSARGGARIRGVEIRLTPAEVIEAARQALSEQKGTAANCYSWFVPVDQIRVSPKWLISLITGLPVSAFHSVEARRALNQLGVQVSCMEF